MILFITFIERYYLQDTSQLGPEDVAVNKKETTPALKDHKIQEERQYTNYLQKLLKYSYDYDPKGKTQAVMKPCAGEP